MFYKKLFLLLILLLFIITTSYCNLLYAVKSDTIWNENQFLQTRQERDFYIRAEMLLAQIDIGKGRVIFAYNRLLELHRAYPDISDIQTALISLESFLGLHLRALDRLESEAEKSSIDQTITAISNHINEQRRSSVRFEERLRFLNNNSETIRTLEGNIRHSPNIEIGVRTVLNYVTAEDIQRAYGDLGDFTTWRRKHELYGSYEFYSGTKLKLSLFTNERYFGGGLNLKAPLILGGADFFADLNRPVWDFTEGALDYAAVSRAGMQQFFTIRLNSRPMVRFAYNRYHVREFRNVSESFLLFGVWRIPIQVTRIPAFFEYGLSAEYLTNSKTNYNGSEHRYYPLIDREVHYATLGLRLETSTQFVAQSFFEIYLGWAYDRFGENGPQTGLVFLRQLSRDIEFKLFGGYGAVTAEGTASTTGFTVNAGVHLLWKFN